MAKRVVLKKAKPPEPKKADPMESRRLCFGKSCGELTRVGSLLCAQCNTPKMREEVRNMVYCLADEIQEAEPILACHEGMLKRVEFLEQSLRKVEQLLSVGSPKQAHKSAKEALWRD